MNNNNNDQSSSISNDIICVFRSTVHNSNSDGKCELQNERLDANMWLNVYNFNLCNHLGLCDSQSRIRKGNKMEEFVTRRMI